MSENNEHVLYILVLINDLMAHIAFLIIKFTHNALSIFTYLVTRAAAQS